MRIGDTCMAKSDGCQSAGMELLSWAGRARGSLLSTPRLCSALSTPWGHTATATVTAYAAVHAQAQASCVLRKMPHVIMVPREHVLRKHVFMDACPLQCLPPGACELSERAWCTPPGYP